MTTPMVWKVPRETEEWVGPIVVTVSGVAVTNFTVALLLDETRPQPSDWVTPTLSGTDQGIMVMNKTPGTYKIWVKYVTGLEPGIVLDDAGLVVVT